MTSYIFNHDYILRHDQKRTYIIQRYANNGELKDWAEMIHPVQAMILSFFSKPKLFLNQYFRDDRGTAIRF